MTTFAVNFAFGSYLLALSSYGLGYVLKKKRLEWAGLACIGGAFISLSALLAWRWRAGNYAPMSNMFESLVLMVWMLSLFYLGFLFRSRGGEPGQAPRLLGFGFWVAMAALLLLGAASLNDRSIQSLMPALQSNWLVFHVMVIMAGYAALTLAFLAGGVYIACFRKRREEPKAEVFDGFAERTAMLGFLLLTVGIILGSVWANSAWGSWWSWDPKETWSLITWFFYAAALHLRKARGWRHERFAWLTVGGFALILFTYFGVNYALSGLHSYA